MSTISRFIDALRQRQYSIIFNDLQLMIVALTFLSLGLLGITTGIIRAIHFFVPSAVAPLPSPALRAALEEIHESKILFNPPKEMDQGMPKRVEARISYQEIGDAISKNLKGSGEITLERIPVGKKMSVTLYADEEEFKIKKYSSDEQIVAGKPYAQWEWDVTPLKYGERQLHLKAVINLKTKDDEYQYDIPVIDKVINVKVNPAFIAEQAARNKDIRDLLIGSGSLLGLILATWGGLKAWKKRKKKQQEEEKGRDWETVSNPPPNPEEKPSIKESHRRN